MGEIDAVMNRYISDNARFADLQNVVTFKGRKVLSPDALQEADSVSYAKTQNEEIPVTVKHAYIETRRDVKKKVEFDMRLLIFGTENQAKIHKAMPVRANFYDAAEYHKQYLEVRKRHKEKKDLSGDDFLAGYGSEDRITPVITTVLYTGQKPWDENVDLYGMMHLEEYPPQIRKVILEKVNNYKLNLVDMHQIENYEMFETDLRLLVGFIKRDHNKTELQNFIRDNAQEFATIEEDTYDALAVVSHSTKLIEYKEKNKSEKGGIDVCKALDDWIMEEKEVGKAEGKAEAIIKMCLKYGLSEDEMISNLMQELEITQQQAQQYRDHYLVMV